MKQQVTKVTSLMEISLFWNINGCVYMLSVNINRPKGKSIFDKIACAPAVINA